MNAINTEKLITKDQILEKGFINQKDKKVP